MTFTLSLPWIVAGSISIIAVVACSVLTIRGYRRRKEHKFHVLSCLGTWVIATLIIPYLLGIITAARQNYKYADELRRAKTERRELAKAKIESKRYEKRRIIRKANRAADQAERKDYRTAIEHMMVTYHLNGMAL